MRCDSVLIRFLQSSFHRMSSIPLRRVLHQLNGLFDNVVIFYNMSCVISDSWLPLPPFNVLLSLDFGAQSAQTH